MLWAIFARREREGGLSDRMTQPPPGWRFHPERDQMLAEAHARPSTPAAAPLLAARIATLSGETGVAVDRAHMAALCRKLSAPEPGPDARWCIVDGGTWRLRWERHTELSTWTVFRPAGEDADSFAATALDVVPQDWLAAMPGDVLAAAHVALVEVARQPSVFAEADLVASEVAAGALQVFTDFRAGPDGFTRFVLVQRGGGAVLAGRLMQQLFEIETYRLLALLAFPAATGGAQAISAMEAEATQAAMQVSEAGGVDADRELLAQLAALAGRAEAAAAGTGFRFAASRAYYGLVQERIAQLNEHAIEGRPSIRDFMERRLAPAMRTVSAAADRQREVIARVARTTQMLAARVNIASEATNASLLKSMDRRAQLQLRLQETVEGLSAAAISYYALGLFKILVEGLSHLWQEVNPHRRWDIDPTLATGLAAPVVVLLVWLFLRRIRAGIMQDHDSPA